MGRESPIEMKQITKYHQSHYYLDGLTIFGYSLYSVLHTVDSSSTTAFGKTLQNEIFDSFFSDNYLATSISSNCAFHRTV